MQEKETAKKIFELEANYKKSLEELSLVDPIASYKLFGQTDFFKLINILSDHLTSLKTEFSGETENIDSQTQNIMDFFKPELLKRTLQTLEGDIKQISNGIGLFTRYKAAKILNNQKKPVDESQLLTLNVYLEKFLPK